MLTADGTLELVADWLCTARYFHIHIVNCKHAIFDSESSNTALHALDRYHRLDTIVALLEANGEYFATAALPVLLNASTAAWYEIPVPSK